MCVGVHAGVVTLVPLNLVAPQTPHKICRFSPQDTLRSKLRDKGGRLLKGGYGGVRTGTGRVDGKGGGGV